MAGMGDGGGNRHVMARILAVDDDEDFLDILKDWLLSEDHQVETANCGFKAWTCLQGGEFDIVILDWDLPDVNGIDILKRYRAAGSTTPVIMLTGRTSVDDKEKGLDTGADDYLTKPFHVKELSARIRAALRKREGASAPVARPLGVGNEAVLARGDLIGTTLAARYEFLDVIGEGGVGIVFKARHPRLDKLVAVKMLQAAALKDHTIARFEREAKAISRLDHPSVAVVYDFGVTERQRPYMVMEYIEGPSLEDIIRWEGAVPLPRVLDVMVPVCDGMEHAHAAGVIHRDIKPSNIMLKQVTGRPPAPKILDFGCAKLTEGDSPESKSLTQMGHSFGSPPYMSPEQVRGRALDARSDVYSLGCVIYELVTGRLPHDDDNVVEIMFKHLEAAVVPMRQARPDLAIPEGLERIVARAMEKDADRRYQTMQELKEELEKVKADQAAAPG